VVTGRFKHILLSIALAVMASRVIVGAHFPSDVLFGAYLGVVVTELIAAGFERKGLVIARKPEKAPPQAAEKTDAI
jgi:membrane-associated phospholipid phosphatase